MDQLERLNAADPSCRFQRRLDIQHLGIFGHSFGGATALWFCHDDFRCKAGIDLDGQPFGSVIKEGLTKPFLFLLSDDGDLSAPEPNKVITDIESIYDHLFRAVRSSKNRPMFSEISPDQEVSSRQ